MKYLVIDTRGGGDFSLDLLFAGLVKVAGYENVFDFPRKTKHREWDWNKADWGMERRTHGYTPDNWMVSSDPRQIVAEAAKGNLTVFTDERDESYHVYRNLGLSSYETPVVVVAGHDRFWNISPQFVKERAGWNCVHMFLDDWLPAYDSLPWASLTSLSTNYDHFWNRPSGHVEKKYDIFFFGYNSHPDRARYVDHILNHPTWSKLNNRIMLERQSDTLGNFILKREYFQTMLESRVCLNLRGASVGGRALRYYEIPYVGSFMLTQKFQAPQVDRFEPGVHCGEFRNETSLDIMLETFFDNPEEREFIAGSGHRYAMDHHTCEARVRYMLKEIG